MYVTVIPVSAYMALVGICVWFYPHKLMMMMMIDAAAVLFLMHFYGQRPRLQLLSSLSEKKLLLTTQTLWQSEY